MKTKCKVCGKKIDIVNVTCGECVEKNLLRKKHVIITKIPLNEADKAKLTDEFEEFVKSDNKVFVLDGSKADIREIWV